MKCNQCEQKFCAKYILDRHIKRNHDIQSHMCDKCQSNFNKKTDLRTHVKSCQLNFICFICKSEFLFRKNLLKHQRNIHVVNELLVEGNIEKEMKFTCTQCKKCFTTKCNLQRHQQQVHASRKRKAEDDIHYNTIRKRAQKCSNVIGDLIKEGGKVGEHVVKDLFKSQKKVTAKVASEHLAKEG